jgi:hypothetical protein
MNASRVGVRPSRALLLVLHVLVLLLLPAVTMAGPARKADPGNAGNPRVYPPGSRPFGLGYGEWSARWWQWAYGLPAPGHPLFDETGADCAAGQSGPVWFLGGVFNVSGSAVRDLCTVPAGKAILFPIINAEWDNVCPPSTYTDAELRQFVTDAINSVTALAADVDGVPIENLSAYRFAGPSFAVDLPPGSLFDLFCGTPPGHYSPFVPDGYYVMLTPLSPGPHTIHFTGTIAASSFTLDIVYHLNVANGNAVVTPGDPAAGATIAPTAGSDAAGHTSWGRVKSVYR